MPLSSDLIDRLPHVEGILNYLAPMPEKPMNLAYDPPPGVPRSTGVPEPHRMTIYDARPVAAQLSLDSEGLALFEHKSAMRDFYDEDELRRVYYPEAERLVAEVTGASRVLVFDHTIRRRVWGDHRSLREEREQFQRNQKHEGSKIVVISRGTGSSNPSPSSGESCK